MAAQSAVASTDQLLGPKKTQLPLLQTTHNLNNGIAADSVKTATSPTPNNSSRLSKIYTKSTPPPSSPVASTSSSAKRTRSHRTTSTSSSTSSASAIATTAATLRSNHISIVSLEDDDDDDDDDDGNCSSSLCDSDSDSDLDNMSVNLSTLVANGMLHKPPSTPAGGTAIRSNGMIVINSGTPTEIVRSPTAAGGNSNRPHIGSIALQNSTDITFGDKTFYQGPVTVKQFFLEKDQWRRQESNTTTAGSSHSGTVPTATAGGGHDNGAYVSHGDGDGGTSSGNKANNTAASTSDSPNGNSPESGAKSDAGRTCWKKLLQLERRPLVLAVLVTLTLFFMAMIALATYLILLPTMGPNKIPPGDGEDSRLNGPTNSTIGTP